jgi:putative peptidoglycan lipid II flippase
MPTLRTPLRPDTGPPRLGGPTAPSLAAAASIVALGFLGSRLLGLVRTIVFARQYGTSPDLDAFFVAFRIPDLIFQLLAGAAIGAAFIPVFARVTSDEGAGAGWRLASNVMNLLFVATAAVATVGLLAAPVLVPLTAPGLGEETGQEAELTSLAVDLTRIMMISPVLFAISGMFMGILNARHHFLAPAIAPMFYNGAIIVGALITDDMRVLAMCVVLGALLHLLVQVPALRLVGMVWRPFWDWQDRAVREVARLMGPRVIGLAAFHLNFVVATFFASTLVTGSISAINYAWLIVMTPLGLFGMAISTAVFPRMAEQAARDDGEMPETLGQSLRMILFLTIPATAGLVVLAKPLTELFLAGGAFDDASTELVVGAIAFYALGLFAHSSIEILSRGFYAMSDTRTPVAFAVISMVLNVLFSLALVWSFGVEGLALSLTMATIIEFVLLFRTLDRRVAGLGGARLATSVLRTVTATVLMTQVVLLWLALLELGGFLDVETKPDAALALLGATVLGTVTYAVTSRILRSEEVRILAERAPMPEALRALAVGRENPGL